jgi:hypothetical protein
LSGTRTIAVFFAAFVAAASQVRAEPPQVPRLVELLLNAEGYRVRTQAAYSLGAFTGPDVQDALLSALMDPHEAVRVAALVSLAKAGDASVISLLRGSDDPNAVVKEQLRHTLVLLEERFPETRVPLDWTRVSTIIEAAGLRDESSCGRSELPDVFQRLLARQLRMQDRLAVAEAPRGLDQMGDVISRNKLRALFVTGAVSQMAKRKSGADVVWDVSVSLTVMSHPGKSIRAMVTGKASVSRAARTYTTEEDDSMQDRALEDAIRSAVESLAAKIREI